MIYLLLKSKLKKNYVIITFSTIISILFCYIYIQLLKYQDIKYDNILLSKSLVFALFTSTLFEVIFFNISIIKGNKLQDVLISKTNVISFLIINYIVILCSYLTVFAVTTIFYIIFFQISLIIISLVLSVLIALFAVIILGLFIFAYQMRNINSFHKINLFLDFVSILNAETFPIMTFPVVLLIISKLNYSSYISYLLDSSFNGLIFLLFFLFSFIFSIILVNRGIKKYV